MDTRTGDIYTKEQVDKVLELFPELSKRFLPMAIEPTERQLNCRPSRQPFMSGAIGKVGRNESCPCGSKKKFKYCCFAKNNSCVETSP